MKVELLQYEMAAYDLDDEDRMPYPVDFDGDSPTLETHIIFKVKFQKDEKYYIGNIAAKIGTYGKDYNDGTYRCYFPRGFYGKMEYERASYSILNPKDDIPYEFLEHGYFDFGSDYNFATDEFNKQLLDQVLSSNEIVPDEEYEVELPMDY